MCGNSWFLCFFSQLWESEIGQVKMAEIAQVLLLCYSLTIKDCNQYDVKTEENNSFKIGAAVTKNFPC